MTSPLEQARELVERGEKASPGPWTSTEDTPYVKDLWAMGHPVRLNDAYFIAYSRTAAPAVAQALIELVEVAGGYLEDTDEASQHVRVTEPPYEPYCDEDGEDWPCSAERFRSTLAKITGDTQ